MESGRDRETLGYMWRMWPKPPESDEATHHLGGRKGWLPTDQERSGDVQHISKGFDDTSLLNESHLFHTNLVNN